MIRELAPAKAGGDSAKFEQQTWFLRSGCNSATRPKRAGNRHKTTRGKTRLAIGPDFGETELVTASVSPGLGRYARPASQAGFAISGLRNLQMVDPLAGPRISPAIWKVAAKCGRSREHRHNLLIAAASDARDSVRATRADHPSSERLCLSRSPGYLFQDDADQGRIRARCSLGRR